MLRELRIKNFAVIDAIAIEFGAGLNIITGETGAGKSILLDALNLIAGERGSTEIIRHKADEATVEALFDELPAGLCAQLEEAGIAVEDELVVKRIITRAGKNRIYLNGCLCPLNVLAQIGRGLVHIYGQHEHHLLLQTDNHLNLLDAYADVEESLATMTTSYTVMTEAFRELAETRANLEQRRRERELLEAQAAELDRAQLRQGEDEELRTTKHILSHAEKLLQGCREGEELLYEGDASLVGGLGKYAAKVKELAAIDQALNPTVELLDSSLAQLQEAATQLRRYADRIQFDPHALEQLEDRLAEIQRLKRKYNGELADLLRLRDEIANALASLGQGDELIAGLEKRFDHARQAAWVLAEKISSERQRAARKLKREMEKEVRTLGMADTTFAVHFATEEGKEDEPPFLLGGRRLTEKGMDQVEFYFSPNPGEPVKPLARIASGGELSRLMLALKSLVLSKEALPTLLFDEVDTGVGGRVAEIVGKKLKQVSRRQQVINVTHLPQIAAMADKHFVVDKRVEKGRTYTHVSVLDEAERVKEVARMLGGVKVTDQARRHAQEMIRGE